MSYRSDQFTKRLLQAGRAIGVLAVAGGLAAAAAPLLVTGVATGMVFNLVMGGMTAAASGALLIGTCNKGLKKIPEYWFAGTKHKTRHNTGARTVEKPGDLLHPDTIEKDLEKRNGGPSNRAFDMDNPWGRGDVESVGSTLGDIGFKTP